MGVKAARNAARAPPPLHAANECVTILNQRVQYSQARSDASFAALSDATRRGVLEQLLRGDASITDLAEKFQHDPHGHEEACGRPGAGQARQDGEGRGVRGVQPGPRRLQEETAWLRSTASSGDSTFRRAGQGCRRTETEGGGRWTQEEREPALKKNHTTVERRSERELVVTRTFNGPARIVFEAWTTPELFRRWWVPKSMGMSLRSCGCRVGGRYRLEFEPDAVAFSPAPTSKSTPHSRLVWTNEEGGEGGPVTTVTFEDKGGKTLLVLHELYSSKEVDAAGSAEDLPIGVEQAQQQLRVAQWAVPLLTGILEVLNALHGEQQRPGEQTRGMLQKAVSLTGQWRPAA